MRDGVFATRCGGLLRIPASSRCRTSRGTKRSPRHKAPEKRGWASAGCACQLDTEDLVLGGNARDWSPDFSHRVDYYL